MFSRSAAALCVAGFALVYILHVRLSRPTSYSPDTSMDEPSAAQKRQLDGVVELMLEIYHTLGAMRYLDPLGIQEGPHDVETMLPTYGEHKLDPAIVYLYKNLPYIDSGEAGEIDFLFGGYFADFRNEGDVEQGRDPFYGSPDEDGFEDENGPYMRPWYTPLSNMGNHQSVIVYDARKHRIWIIDQEGWSSTDPALEGVPEAKSVSKNRNSFEHIPSRPAGEVLRDIVHWLRTLKIIPGGGEHDSWGGHWDYDALNKIYLQHGWPDHFDGDAFAVAAVRWHCGVEARYFAEEPLRVVEKYQNWLKWGAEDSVRLREEVTKADNLDEHWVAKFKLWKHEQNQARLVPELMTAEKESARLCPIGVCQRKQDLILFELEKLRQELKGKRDEVRQNREWAEETKDEPERTRGFLIEMRHAEKKLAIYEKAYAEAKADAERLRPGIAFESIINHESVAHNEDPERDIARTKEGIVAEENWIELVRQWAAQVPSGNTQAETVISQELENSREGLERSRKGLQRSETWFAEHGREA